MNDGTSFDDRMFLGGQAVYQRILDGQVTDVEAELMDAQFRASGGEEQ